MRFDCTNRWITGNPDSPSFTFIRWALQAHELVTKSKTVEPSGDTLTPAQIVASFKKNVRVAQSKCANTRGAR